MKPYFAFLALLMTVFLPVPAQHFSTGYVDVRLLDNDSILVEVGVERQDMMNAVGVFPPVEGLEDEGFGSYQKKVEAYLQTRTIARIDGKRLWLAVVRWKPGGKDRNDWLDSATSMESYHLFTLGGKLPPNPKTLSIRSDLWVERPDKPSYTRVEYALHEGKTPLRRLWIGTERWLNFPLHPDSLAHMRKIPPPPASIREVDHSGHNH